MVPPDEYKEYHENVLQSHRHKQLNTQLQVQYNRVHWGARRGNLVTHNARKPFGWGAFSASSLSKTEHYSPAVGWDVLYVRCLFIRPWCSLFYSIRIRDIDITRRRHHNTGSLLHEVPASDPPHSMAYIYVTVSSPPMHTALTDDVTLCICGKDVASHSSPAGTETADRM